jgi:hypothetical protein
MMLMEVAGRDRHGGGPKDEILKIPISVLTLQDRIEERYNDIRELTIFGVDEETGQPRALGFKDQGEAERLQKEIAGLTDQKAVLVALVESIEEVFESYGMHPRSMQALDEQISEIINAPQSIAFKINGKVRALMDSNRGITLAEIWSNPEIMALETERGRMTTRGGEEAAVLVRMKDEILPICRQAGPLVQAVRRPGRDINPATIAVMEAAAYGEDEGFLGGLSELEEEVELNRMEAGLERSA